MRSLRSDHVASRTAVSKLVVRSSAAALTEASACSIRCSSCWSLRARCASSWSSRLVSAAMNSRLPAMSHIPASPRKVASTPAAAVAIVCSWSSDGSASLASAQSASSESSWASKSCAAGTGRVSGRDNTAIMPHIPQFYLGARAHDLLKSRGYFVSEGYRHGFYHDAHHWFGARGTQHDATIVAK